MLERLAGNQYYCFLDGFSGYFQIPIDLKDQEKTTFTCPYGTFAYRCMPFGLCNAPGMFQSFWEFFSSLSLPIRKDVEKTDIVKLMVEIESFGMSFDEFDKETGSSDGLQPKQADLSCVHALNELHLHEIHVFPSKHEADQY
nr:reverse transcriptase domain-containing protein [Tanacetum cinerariifolium]